MASGIGRGESRHKISLFAEEVEQLVAKLARRDQRQTDGLLDHLVTFATPPNRRYRIGRRMSVSSVEDKSPPITTIASGRWISDPGPEANSSGINPSAVMLAV